MPTTEEISETQEASPTTGLLLPSLEISGYRCFKHLSIPKLGRVNLIVGKNNVGKTSLLEAVWLYSLVGNNDRLSTVLAHLLLCRDEIGHGENISIPLRTPLRNLLYNRPFSGDNQRIRIGDAGHQQPFLVISFAGSGLQFLFEAQSNGSPQSAQESSEVGHVEYSRLVDVARTVHSLEGLSLKSHRGYFSFIEANGLSWYDLTSLWDKIYLTPLEEKVVSALRIIESRLERIGFSEDKSQLINHRIPMILLEGQTQPTPLKSAGDGMNKLLGIALSLVNSKDKFLLIDEVEVGLHYSIQYDMWRLIFATARELNVQVFATTHSWDCVEAFQQAAVEDEQSEGMLIRLEAKGEETKVTLFDERRLSIATKEHIEVR